MKVIPTVSNNLPEWAQRDMIKLSGPRRETLMRFIRELERKGASRWTIKNYVMAIRTLGFDGKSYEELSTGDLEAWMDQIGANGWAPETVNTNRKCVKSFLRWLDGCKSARDPTPERLKCIRQQWTRKKLPKVILSQAEIRRLLDASGTQRDRALIFVAYESGARAGEILSLKIGSAEFDCYGAVLRVHGKTGERCIRLVESVPDLRLWISMHPRRGDADAMLWPTLRQRKGPLGADGFQILLRRLSKEAGINKHIHPHLLRHSRATHLANVLTEAQMREFFGWTKASDMPSVYVHLSGRDVDATLLKHYGIMVEAAKEDLLEPKACPWCQVVNPPSAKFCQQCNAPLDPANASKAMEKQRKRMELVERFVEKLREEAPSIADGIFRELRKEIEELAE